MDLQLTDSVALVAGSSRGIGRAIAAALLAEGARVLVTGRSAGDVATAVSELGGGRPAARVRGFAGDLTQSAAVAGALEDVAAHWGRLDAVVANIGQGGWPGEWDAPDDVWREAFALNLFGSLALARAAVPRLHASRGSLIFIASIAGCETIGAPPAYEAAKAALLHATKALSRQLGPVGVRVNAVAPGNVYFPGGVWERKRRANPEAVEEYIRREVPLGRFGAPEEIAAAVAFLASPVAAFITGATLVIDGGQTRAA